MKKGIKYIAAVVLAVIVLAGAVGGYSYAAQKNQSFVLPTVTLNGHMLQNNGCTWHQPVFFGLFYKSFTTVYDLALPQPFTVSENALAIEVTQEFKTTVTITNGNGTVFTGSAEELANFTFTANGDYSVSVLLERKKTAGQAYGTISYWGALHVDIKPAFTLFAASVPQGDIFTLQVTNLFAGQSPSATSGLGAVHFVLAANGYAAYIPVAYNRSPGSYPLAVSAGGESYETTLTVTAREFEVQYMEIEQSTYDNTAGSATASTEYRTAIYPLYDLADETQYWSGPFLQPVQARVSTEYGLYRYVNGQYSERHSGIDFAADGGTPVLAPANGRVVFSGFLQLSGNTIVVEHGGGMKSFFFHMSGREAELGDMVERGQVIGYVGATGYATGDHLHYEVKIGSQSINPWLLFSGESSVFSAPAAVDILN